ncbi:cysteine desulfurase [Natranaerovirga pectinivora]|uniref:Cysteine desulfurase n=1 Tax=Natranaerovirga pectinivora TaxID=682400 RepID=A0A4V2V0L7_9FIRM|nr:cysteine desulfurase family protein [Natranaerovirga pectinivora]TCT16879.1 cysteine desulfurase [Natranaerovirga pectinivora]
MEVYFDNAATTKPFPEVIDKIVQGYEEYGNTSSLHNKGIRAEKLVKEAKSVFAKLLKVDDKELFFTSGGTESNNLAIIGTALANRRSGKHIITSSIEHASVLNTMKALEEDGFVDTFEITVIEVNKEGIIDIEALKDAIREDTILVSLMHVNNEIGSVQPIKEIGRIIKESNSKTLFHVDGVQSFGKYSIHPKKDLIDLLSISAHKIHGPKGVGLLFVKDKVKIKPIIFGGNHQKGLRSGTENVPGVMGFAEAAKLMYESLEEKIQYLYNIKKELAYGILNNIDDTAINGSIEEGAPHILNIRFKYIRSEVLMHTLENNGIYVSTGSACSSNKNSTSQVLKCLGLDINEVDESVRFSFSVYNTIEEVNYCIENLKKEVPFLRRYVRGGK